MNKRDENGLRLQTYKRFKAGESYTPINADEMTDIVGFIQHCNKIHKGIAPKYENVEEFLGVIDAFWEIIIETNQNGVSVIPDVEGFCCFAGISREALNSWEHERTGAYPIVIKNLKNTIAAAKKQLALRGKIPPIVFATDFNNNHGYTQKQQVEVSAPSGGLLGPVSDIEDIETFRQRLEAGLPDDD